MSRGSLWAGLPSASGSPGRASAPVSDNGVSRVPLREERYASELGYYRVTRRAPVALFDNCCSYLLPTWARRGSVQRAEACARTAFRRTPSRARARGAEGSALHLSPARIRVVSCGVRAHGRRQNTRSHRALVLALRFLPEARRGSDNPLDGCRARRVRRDT